MANRDSTTPIQGAFEGMPEPTEQRRRDQYAFGGFLKEEIYDVFGDLPIADLTEGERDWFSPSRLARICLADPRDPDVRRQRERFDGVLLNPAERAKLLYSSTSLGNRALDRTLSASVEIDEDALGRSRRSSVHAVETKIERMESYTGSLLLRRSDIMELHAEARFPGAAHKRKERMHQLFSGSWQEMLNLADTLQDQRLYTDDQKQRLLASSVHYLTAGPQKDRVHNWKKLLEFQKQYLDARVSIFGRQIARAQKSISTD